MLAPALWDAACLVTTSLAAGRNAEVEAALAGLGVDRSDPELARLVRARMLQVIPWSALTAARTGR